MAAAEASTSPKAWFKAWQLGVVVNFGEVGSVGWLVDSRKGGVDFILLEEKDPSYTKEKLATMVIVFVWGCFPCNMAIHGL